MFDCVCTQLRDELASCAAAVEGGLVFHALAGSSSTVCCAAALQEGNGEQRRHGQRHLLWGGDL